MILCIPESVCPWLNRIRSLAIQRPRLLSLATTPPNSHARRRRQAHDHGVRRRCTTLDSEPYGSPRMVLREAKSSTNSMRACSPQIIARASLATRWCRLTKSDEQLPAPQSSSTPMAPTNDSTTSWWMHRVARQGGVTAAIEIPHHGGGARLVLRSVLTTTVVIAAVGWGEGDRRARGHGTLYGRDRVSAQWPPAKSAPAAMLGDQVVDGAARKTGMTTTRWPHPAVRQSSRARESTETGNAGPIQGGVSVAHARGSVVAGGWGIGPCAAKSEWVEIAAAGPIISFFFIYFLFSFSFILFSFLFLNSNLCCEFVL